MLKLNDDILYTIISYLNNKDSLSIVLTCKYYKNFFYKVGFVKYLNIFRNSYELFEMYNSHYRTLISMSLSHMNNPQHWIFGNWCKKVSLINCILTDKIDPTKPCLEEELSIYNIYNIYKNIPIRINWKKFPKLKILKLDVYDIELENIESCSNLEVVYINLNNKKKDFTSNLKSLKKIKVLLTNA